MDVLAGILAKGISWLTYVVVMMIGAYLLFVLIAGKIQFYIGLLFGPIALMMAPFDKGATLMRIIGLMLTGLTSFAISFAVLTLSVTAMGGVIETFKTASYNSAINGDYARLTIAAGSLLFAYMVWLIVHSSTSWASGIFGGISANLRGATSTIGLGGAATTYAGARVAGALGGAAARGSAGAAGAVGSRMASTETFQKGVNTVSRATNSIGKWMDGGSVRRTIKTGAMEMVKASKGGFAAARGRGPALTSKPPRMGSGLRLVDSFRDGAAAVGKRPPNSNNN